jgi:4-methylaminobutanoate oxidase (formaldehyde-forming)
MSTVSTPTVLAIITTTLLRSGRKKAWYYRLRFPREQGWRVRIVPAIPSLLEHGAVFGEKFGWERVNYFQPGKPSRRMGEDQREWGWSKPPFFERMGEEHKATRERVTLFDLTSFGKIEISGAGALKLNETCRQQPGQACWASSIPNSSTRKVAFNLT